MVDQYVRRALITQRNLYPEVADAAQVYLILALYALYAPYAPYVPGDSCCADSAGDGWEILICAESERSADDRDRKTRATVRVLRE